MKKHQRLRKNLQKLKKDLNCWTWWCFFCQPNNDNHSGHFFVLYLTDKGEHTVFYEIKKKEKKYTLNLKPKKRS